jgi:hypothetical protein
MELAKPAEIDRMLRYPDGRAARLAEKGLLPHIRLPDGEIRFDAVEIRAMLQAAHQPAAPSREAAHA